MAQDNGTFKILYLKCKHKWPNKYESGVSDSHLQDEDFILGRLPDFPSIFFQEFFAGVHFQRVPVLRSENLTELLARYDTVVKY